MREASQPIPVRTSILGLPFFSGTLEQAVDTALQGGVVAAPSGPGLANDFVISPSYRRALQGAHLLLTDSAVMVALYRLATGHAVPRHSGLKFLNALLDREELKGRGRVLWVMPSPEQSSVMTRWLASRGFDVSDTTLYHAPKYVPGAVEDPELLRIALAMRPSVIVLNIGGGTQEILGHWLAQRLNPAPAIICTGAALGFLAGTQVYIPPLVDRLGLGWLWRSMSNPRLYVPRYWAALPLIPMVLRYRDRLPPMQT
jgi:N-acetylglucosaminyldiphosphoundecaprenol N-acetyl-beta-D-mannosaminyltransferase